MGVLTVRRTAGCVAVGSVALGLGALALAYVDRHQVPAGLTAWDFSNVLGGAANLGVPVVGFVIASRRPGNRVGWLFLVAGLALGLGGFAAAYGLHALVAAPGSWPAGQVGGWLSNWIWVIPFAALSFVFLLFPAGQLRSRRWRPAAWFAGGAFAVTGVAVLVEATRSWSDPFGLTSHAGSSPLLVVMAIALVGAALVVSVVAVVVRFARSAGEERLQLKWFAVAAVLVVATLIPSLLTDSVIAAVFSNLAFLCLWVAIGFAVLKYRLYDIDVVISKAVLYGSLAVFITAVYAGLVVGVGTLAGGRDRPLVAAVAAAVVAVAFQPARQWARRLANRVVYGRRASPYQVLSDFARRIGGTHASEDVLPQMARTVAAGTGAERVVVWLRVGDQLRPEGSAGGGPAAAPLPLDGDAMPALPGADMSIPVRHGDDLLGAISIRMPKDEQLGPAGEQLVADVASQAGLVLSNVGLVEDLRASRQRLVAAQDEERRRLERNIHDGAQQDLVALAIKLRLAATTAEDLAQAKEIFGELQADTTGALANLRDLAQGIYPPLLADLGLAAALNARAGKSPLPVDVEADGIGRFTQDTEAAVYFCCLEALQNITKYAHASQAHIIVQSRDGALCFTVSDDGSGYDTSHTPLGSGQRNMADRLAALGGRLEVRSAPQRGTTVTGHLPLSPVATAAAQRPGA